VRGQSTKNARRIANELRAMHRSISMLNNAVRRLGPILKLVASTNGHPAGGDSRVRAALSPKQRAALKLQGRYMGFIRQLTPKQKAEIRRIREKSGIETAIKRAMQLARG